jgi:hypothetical protein
MRAASSATASIAVPTNPDPDTELSAVKARARAAYQAAKKRGAAPAGLLDRWHVDTLLALDGAPPRAQVVMAYRTELLFQLLIDRQRWLDRE